MNIFDGLLWRISVYTFKSLKYMQDTSITIALDQVK